MQNLNKLTVMVTRPKPQGEVLSEQIRAAGGEVVYFPTIEIKPPEDMALFTQNIQRLDQYDWVIFVSPQSVYQSMPVIKKYWPQFPAKVKVAALGGGTVDALREAHISVDVSPGEKDWGSEGLLENEAFQELAHKNVALICGESGRELLAETLTIRGVNLTNIIAYQRGIPQVDVSKYVRLVQEHKIDIILCTSGEILYNLKLLLENAWGDLKKVPVVVISERMKMLAKQLEFETILLAKNASHPAMLTVLKDFVCKMKK